jgi:hypothetical protein
MPAAKWRQNAARDASRGHKCPNNTAPRGRKKGNTHATERKRFRNNLLSLGVLRLDDFLFHLVENPSRCVEDLPIEFAIRGNCLR